MSFMDFSSYITSFNRLDAKLSDMDMQKKYYDKWMQKYARIFKCETKQLNSIEWDLRCRKALHEIFSSATFFIEAKKCLEMCCFSSYYFCLYYSLFHAIYAAIFLDTDSIMNSLLNITHRNIINIFTSAYCKSKKDIMSKEVNVLFNELKYRREYYSYATPFNNLFDYKNDLERLKDILLDTYQLTSFHSLMIENSYCKNIGKVTKISNKYEIYEFEKLFYSLFSKKDISGNNKLDTSCEILKDELVRDGFRPYFITLDLEHQYDEFHSYDFDFHNKRNDEALKVSDILLFITEAIM